jgi:RNA recognition motif-containing protein
MYEEQNLTVYVSRLPSQWNDSHLSEHFEACFGKVVSAKITCDGESGKSRGFGFVTFENEESRKLAIEQKSIHVKKKTIRIREFLNSEERDNGAICFAWKNNNCVKGDNCKFVHEGEGSCIEVSLPGSGKRQKCLSFKSKGKCSKGDSCPFLHIKKQTTNSIIPDNNAPKICHNFKSKGKCRKGDTCKFSHIMSGSKSQYTATDTTTPTATTHNSKKRIIDGNELVIRRKKIFLENQTVEEGV